MIPKPSLVTHMSTGIAVLVFSLGFGLLALFVNQVIPVTVTLSRGDRLRLDVVPIVYGEPSEELVRRARRGEVVLGGCVITQHSPRWAIVL